MRLTNTLLVLCIVTFFQGVCFSQDDAQIKKLLKKLSAIKEDKNKIDLYVEIGFEYENSDLDKSLKYYDKAISAALNLNAKVKLPKIYSSKGVVFQYMQEYDSSVVWFNHGIRIAEEIKDTSQLAKLYNNLGNTYFYNDKMKLAIPSYKKGLIYAKSIQLDIVTGSCYRGIGNCYDKLKNYEYCELYHTMALQLDKRNNFVLQTAMDYSNLGTLYIDQKRFVEADEYFVKSRKIFIDLGIEGEQLALNYNNQASVRFQQKKYAEALELFKKSKEQYRLSKVESNIQFSNKNIASTLLYLEKIELAKIYIDSALQYFTLKNEPYIALDAEMILAEILMKQNKHKEASELLSQIYYEKDSLEDNYQREKLNELELKFQTKEKDLLLEKSSKDLKIKQSESDRRKMFIFSLAGVGILLLLLLFSVRRSNHKIKKANGMIENQNNELIHQKRLIQDSNQSLISSIRYAQNLQNAILPSKENLIEIFPKHLNIYLPKDIVAGDFYWLEITNDLVFFAVADCTGHGVPGAMVSVVCYNALNQSLRDYKLTDPSAILEQARTIVVKTFEKNSVNIKDGMDIALCAYNPSSKELKFAGANNSLLIIRKKELIKLSASRQSIGFSDNETPFKTHSIQLQSKDRLYAYSDGYADQFGGPKDKKYKSKCLEDFLLSIQNETIEAQEVLLLEEFNYWKGSGEQTDDVSLLGIEIQ